MKKPRIIKRGGLWFVTPPFAFPLGDAEEEKQWRAAWFWCEIRNLLRPSLFREWLMGDESPRGDFELD